MGFGIGFCFVFSFLVFFYKVFPLMLLLPLLFWVLYLVAKRGIQNYRKAYKPAIIKKILHFIHPGFIYAPEGIIKHETLSLSGIFPIDPTLCYGEDYISGNIGNICFEICELQIFHPSVFKSKPEKLFDGLFFHSEFSYNTKGRLMIIPNAKEQRFTVALKNMVRSGAKELKDSGNSAFDARFRVFCDEDLRVAEILSPATMAFMLKYYHLSGKELYASFSNTHFFFAMGEKYRLLDSSILKSNLSYEKISGLYRDLLLYMQIVQDFDHTH